MPAPRPTAPLAGSLHDPQPARDLPRMNRLVTALFRHPLGLPIPHTAIIPRKKDQIGASLGTFVEENFLTRAVVEEKLATIDVPGRLGTFLGAPGRAERLAGDASAALTALTELLRDEDLQPAVAGLVDRKLHETPAAPV